LNQHALGFYLRCGMPAASAIRHALSVDVEDWYHDGGAGLAAGTPERVVPNTERLLDLLAAGGSRATFFFLGEVAERHPALVRRVAAEGHEIGSHGYAHRHLSQLLWREFRDDVERSLAILQDITGAAVQGFRAPYFGIKAGVRWPIALLGELELRYDSSILAIDRPPGLELVCPRAPYRHDNGLWEVPVAVLRLLRFWHLPLASGTGLRLLPRRLLRRCIGDFERDVGAGVFYLHPWELDCASPTGPGRGRWLLRLGREHLAERLAGLMEERRFVPIREAFPQVTGQAPQ
jgi:polysaccharide deacetylase family protein (PEP-CTERM system associated)